MPTVFGSVILNLRGNGNHMAQHPPIASIATTSGITTGALGVYMHTSWEALYVMVSLSTLLIVSGHVRFIRGKRVLAKERERRETINLVSRKK
jgi:hypothetical protein